MICWLKTEETIAWQGVIFKDAHLQDEEQVRLDSRRSSVANRLPLFSVAMNERKVN